MAFSPWLCGPFYTIEKPSFVLKKKKKKSFVLWNYVIIFLGNWIFGHYKNYQKYYIMCYVVIHKDPSLDVIRKKYKAQIKIGRRTWHNGWKPGVILFLTLFSFLYSGCGCCLLGMPQYQDGFAPSIHPFCKGLLTVSKLYFS